MSQASPDDTAIVAELKLQDRLTAFRNLRPGARLARLKGGLAQGLLQELLGLPEGVNALQWLAAEQGAAVALLTLKKTLNLAEELYGSVNCVANVPPLFREGDEAWRQSYLRQYGGLYGALLTADAGWTAPTHKSMLAMTCQRGAVLRRRSGSCVGRPGARGRAKALARESGYGYLLADLLRLPDSVDPARWLHTQRLALCAEYVLRVSRGAIPMKDLMDLSLLSNSVNVAPFAPAEVETHTSDRLSVTRLDLLEHFVVYVECRFGVPPDGPFMDNPVTGPTVIWEGFRSFGIARGATTW